MANPSRDWRNQDRSRDPRHGQFYRDSEDNRRYRGTERDDDTDYGRSAEGIGDYGGYSEEERSYRGEFSPRQGRDFGHPDRQYNARYDEQRNERYDSLRERFGRPYLSRDQESRSDRYGQSSFAYGRNETSYPREDSQRFGSERWRDDEGFRGSRYSRESGYSPRESYFGEGYAARDSRNEYGSGYGTGRDLYGSGASHRGKGPKGYQRSDERLKEVICERLSDDPMIDASEITLTVTGGTVRLTGTVDSRGDKFEVEELVSRCSGVKDVDNQLRVQSQLTNGRDLSLSSNAGYAASALDAGSQSGNRRPEAPSTTSGLSSPAKKQ